MDDPLTHFDREGRPRMVDVGDKDVTARRAVARGRIRMASATLTRIREGRTPKGDPLLVAEIAGIQAGKRCADLIPLCHQLPGASIRLSLEPDEEASAVVATAEARIAGRTGVEMEALTAVTVALLTVYDMLKAVDRGMRIEEVRLVEKEGGRSGHWRAEEESGG
ncbi:MAG: cyclic pyranopterin monophosphate synthase MoaC [Gemmatimonadota bacterium]